MAKPEWMVSDWRLQAERELAQMGGPMRREQCNLCGHEASVLNLDIDTREVLVSNWDDGPLPDYSTTERYWRCKDRQACADRVHQQKLAAAKVKVARYEREHRFFLSEMKAARAELAALAAEREGDRG